MWMCCVNGFVYTRGCERDDGVNEGSFRTCGRRGCFSGLLGGFVDAFLMQIVLKMCKGDVIQKRKRKGKRDACWDTCAGGLCVMPALNETYLDIITRSRYNNIHTRWQILVLTSHKIHTKLWWIKSSQKEIKIPSAW